MGHLLRAIVLAALGGVPLTASAWAEAPSSAPRVEARSEPAAVIRLVSDRFDPATVRVRRGQTVLWKNVSLETHTVTDDPRAARLPDNAILPENARPFDSGPLGLGDAFAHTFDIPGVDRYFCLLHEAEHMVGTVIVEP